MALMKLEFWAYLNRADTLYCALCFSTTKFVDCPICPPARSITGDKIVVMSPSDVDLLNEAATEVIRGVTTGGKEWNSSTGVSYRDFRGFLSIRSDGGKSDRCSEGESRIKKAAA